MIDIKWWKIDEENNLSVDNIDNVLSCVCGRHPFLVKPISGQRDRYYGPKKEILICAPLRSGSTLVHQVCEHILPEKTMRTHRLVDSCPILFDYK